MLNTIILFLPAVFMLYLGFILFNETRKEEAEYYTKKKKLFRQIGFIIEGALLIFSILDLAGIKPFSNVKYLCLWCALFGAIAVFVPIFVNSEQIKEKIRYIFRFSLRALFVIAFLEIFIFNFNSFHLASGNYQQKDLPIKSATLQNFVANGATLHTTSPGNASIIVSNINIPVGTIEFNVSSTEKSTVSVSADYVDSTYLAGRSQAIKADVISGNAHSRIIPVGLSGNVSKLTFNFTVADTNEFITVSGITINTPIPLDFSFVRFFFLFFSSLFICILLKSVNLRKPYYEQLYQTKRACKIITLVLIVLAASMIYLVMQTNGTTISKDLSLTSGNQITQDIVDAFQKGKVSLNLPSDSKLDQIKNPYDFSQRESVGQDTQATWDHVYYNGHLYSYYGIAPVIFIFLPYHILTGYYFPSDWAVFIFGAIGILFLGKLFLCFMQKFFKDVPAGFVIMGMIMLQVSCGAWFCFPTPNFYEISQTSGFCCMTIGAYFLFSSNVIGGGKLSYRRLTLSGIFMALAVLCRPTHILYCFVAVLIIAVYFWEQRKKQKTTLKKNNIEKFNYSKYILCALLPYVIFGGIQMIYNFARFGSFFDFGIKYSLTINDFTRSTYDTHMMLIGFFNFLITVPGVTTVFPFIQSNFQTLNTNGYYFIANTSAVGLLFRAIPMFAYFYAYKAFKLLPKGKRLKPTVYMLLGCIAVPFAIIFSIWQSGYGVRYCVDFNWEMLLGAFAIAFTVYMHIKNTTIQKKLYNLFVISLVLCVIVNGAMIYTYLYGAMGTGIQAHLSSFGRLFEFWR
ncbi:MAG: hypothetical protein Q8876_05315 [Bacillota bacterium]|nr:hypothetical protein [Bacillota bacterium]